LELGACIGTSPVCRHPDNLGNLIAMLEFAKLWLENTRFDLFRIRGNIAISCLSIHIYSPLMLLFPHRDGDAAGFIPAGVRPDGVDCPLGADLIPVLLSLPTGGVMVIASSHVIRLILSFIVSGYRTMAIAISPRTSPYFTHLPHTLNNTLFRNYTRHRYNQQELQVGPDTDTDFQPSTPVGVPIFLAPVDTPHWLAPIVAMMVGLGARVIERRINV